MKIEPKQIKIREVFDGYADQATTVFSPTAAGLPFDRPISGNLFTTTIRRSP